MSAILSGIGAALKISKTLIDAFRKAGDSDRAAQLVEIMVALGDSREEITALQNRIKTLEDNSALGKRLIFGQNAYWLNVQTPEADGPFCSACWDTNSTLVHLLHAPSSYNQPIDFTSPHICPTCKSELNTLTPRGDVYPYPAIAKKIP